MNLHIQVSETNDKSIVHLSGEIDIYTAQKLKDELLPLTEKQQTMLVVDLKQVDYMDSTGLGVFIHALKLANQHGCELKLVNLQNRVYRLFQITGLEGIMDIDTNSTIRGVDA